MQVYKRHKRRLRTSGENVIKRGKLLCNSQLSGGWLNASLQVAQAEARRTSGENVIKRGELLCMQALATATVSQAVAGSMQAYKWHKRRRRTSGENN